MTSSFEEIIEKQFDYICKKVIENERKDYLRNLFRIAKHEENFSTVGDVVVNNFSISEKYSIDYHFFNIKGIKVGIENDSLAEALDQLPEKKRNIILLRYFLDMSDDEISKKMGVDRSTIYRNRKNGLTFIKKFMERRNK
ncbi:sigma-70 family RNA polymerase sigma factor [Ligilactobacillus cholophilus]|uniref:sigma-70 family RNA polymerase sigma factor n=1 Tax=Ligilactobacillus cholophilus TaxID=3050131 RepID=UPI0025AF4CFE|nr:sigma-70 family RNA polymerase sigma factor [Ligilactobacillus cholophilus]